MSSENYVKKAPPALVEETKKTIEETKKTIERLVAEISVIN